MSSDLFLASTPSITSALVIKLVIKATVPELDPPIIVPPSDPPTVPGFPGIEVPVAPEFPQRDPPPPQLDINIPEPSIEDPVPPQILPGPAYAIVQRPIWHIRKSREIPVIRRWLENQKFNFVPEVN